MIDMKEVRIDTFSVPMHMRLMHIPTGIVVEGAGESQLSLRKELLTQLEQEIEKPNAVLSGKPRNEL